MTERSLITAERLRSLLHYDPLTGDFCWRYLRGGCRSLIAGNVSPKGYYRIRIDYQMYAAHRLAFLWMRGEWPSKDIDHIDGNGLNNRWENLRECTDSQNGYNRRRLNKNNKSGFKGVSFSTHAGTWVAHIYANKTHYSLGIFPTAEDAARAYDAKAIELHGEFAVLNFGHFHPSQHTEEAA